MNAAQKYRKKPVVIQAIQFTGDNCAEIWDAFGADGIYGPTERNPDSLILTTVHGDEAPARPGDWVIPDGKPGTFYPCKPDIFEATYGPESEPVAVSGDTSDGFHTFAELYEHRHALFIALARSHPDLAWRAREHEDGSMFGGMFIAGLRLPSGDISYHLPIALWSALDQCASTYVRPHWDGHTPADVVTRLNAWNPES